MPTTIVWAALCRFICWEDAHILQVGHRVVIIKTNVVNSTTLQIKPYIVFKASRCVLARAEPSRNSIFRRVLATVGILINCIKGTKENQKVRTAIPTKYPQKEK